MQKKNWGGKTYTHRQQQLQESEKTGTYKCDSYEPINSDHTSVVWWGNVRVRHDTNKHNSHRQCFTLITTITIQNRSNIVWANWIYCQWFYYLKAGIVIVKQTIYHWFNALILF